MVDDVTIPADITTLADYERHAAACLPAETWRHIQDGAGAAGFDRFRLVPRVLGDLRGGGTGIELLGQRHAAPILLAPVAYAGIAHAERELALVRAAAALETGLVVSTLSSVPLEEIAAAGRAAAEGLGTAGAPLWFQLYLQEDRGWSDALVGRAEAAGYQAIVLTVDAAIKRSSFVLPEGVEAANLRGMPRVLQTARPGGRILFGTPLIDAAPRWEDLAWLRARTKLPVVLKGVLSAEDARIAVEHGVDGIVVSNHGGRVLDGLAPPVEMLPAIVEAVAGRAAVLLDGGVRTGGDVVKALALGADAVLVGRPQLHALAVAGMPGVAHMLHMLRAELEQAMAQIGCATVGDISRDRLTG